MKKQLVTKSETGGKWEDIYLPFCCIYPETSWFISFCKSTYGTVVQVGHLHFVPGETRPLHLHHTRVGEVQLPVQTVNGQSYTKW